MTYRVLLVEDDKMVQVINQEYVNRTEKFKVEKIAATYQEACVALKAETYDLVLIDDDLGFGETAGSELLKDIRDWQLDCSVIMLTAQDSPTMIQKGLNYGVHDYILKPFTCQRIKASLDRLDQKWRLLKGKQSLTQNDLDQLYLNGNSSHDSNTNQYLDIVSGPLEKGITPATLELILKAIDQVADGFTISDLTDMTKISHVTIRKYIHFLTQNEYLKPHQEYGQTGRPTIYYSKK